MTTKKNEHLPFACSNGGPVIVIPTDVIAQWGLNPDNEEGSYGSHPDYDNACECEDKQFSPCGGIGWVEVGGKTALVLDAEITTQYVQVDENTGVFYRHGATDVTAQDVLDKLAEISEDVWKAFPKDIDMSSGKFYAFDSAYAGNDLLTGGLEDAQGMECTITPGIYAISWVTDGDELDYIKLSRK